MKISSEDHVLVIGDGKLGLLISQTLVITQCQLTQTKGGAKMVTE